MRWQGYVLWLQLVAVTRVGVIFYGTVPCSAKAGLALCLQINPSQSGKFNLVNSNLDSF